MDGPKVGQVVQYFPSVFDPLAGNGPLAAIVVDSNRHPTSPLVNLVVFDNVGGHHSRCSVACFHPRPGWQTLDPYCEFSPQDAGEPVRAPGQEPIREPLSLWANLFHLGEADGGERPRGLLYASKDAAVKAAGCELALIRVRVAVPFVEVPS